MDGLLGKVRDRIGVTPDQGIQIVTVDQLVRRPIDPGMALVIVQVTESAVSDDRFGVLPGRHGHGPDPVDLLRRLYPPDHPVRCSMTGPTPRSKSWLDDLCRARSWSAAAGPRQRGQPLGLAVAGGRLRAPDGCPGTASRTTGRCARSCWKRAYEVYDALEVAHARAGRELGDLLLQIILHAQYASEAGVFDMSDVQRAITTKIIRRHPHVFGEVEARTSAQVIRNWEQIKADERAANGAAPSRSPDARSLRGPVALAAGAGVCQRDAGPRGERKGTTGRTSRA